MKSPTRVFFVVAALVAVSCKSEQSPPPSVGGPGQPVQVNLPPGHPGQPQVPPGMPQPPPQIPAPPDLAVPPADAIKKPSGLVMKVLQPGTGKTKPEDHDIVSVQFTGWTKDGKMFATSTGRPRPATFPVGKIFPGWSEALKEMVQGEKRRLWIPQNLAFSGRPGAPQGDLVIDSEIVDLKPGPKPVPAPPDVKAAPSDAEKSKSGLASKVVAKGKGAKKPTASSQVEVHYTGWTTDGRMFDSSVVRGTPARFSLSGVIAGWTEGLQLMVEGEKRRFWIPVDLAYKGQPGKPAGMLVFDVELLKILDSAPAPVFTPPTGGPPPGPAQVPPGHPPLPRPVAPPR
ncbi:MAG: FKBP-type peptidyl-prolyl cis-trans isomerase [Deltaproteobacteria bacterium]|nr:FKBP-type peptidyl-prolyl cis-trans isomerase [Deltaproteobacteria bacterium]